MNDTEEFMQLATSSSSSYPVDKRGGIVDPSPISKEEKNKAGQLCQYAEYSNGYAPATRTLAQLPPGVYNIAAGTSQYYFSPQKVITDNLLRLPDSKSEDVIKEIERFWTLKAKFQRYGLTHKRGFLLYGPPGSGKTSTVAVVSQLLVKSGGIVIVGNSGSPQVLSLMMGHLREVEPERPIVVLLEDIDTIIHRYGEAETLALLDGETSIDNVVFLATTNYPEHLDGRIINRPSRFDRVVKIGMPSAEARLMYLKARGVEGDLDRWVEMSKDFSIAHLKELVIGVCVFGNDLDEEIARLRAMAKTPKSDDPKGSVGFNR
jgi:energy-coupling factor transporter ATP-binding protein EcfA2